MSGTVDLGRVDELRVRLAFSRAPEEPPHDVFLLDVRPVTGTGRFDESPYLDLLEPVLALPAGKRRRCVVQVNRTHRSWTDSPGEAEIAVALSSGRATSAMDHEATEVVRLALRKVLDRVEASRAPALAHQEAVGEARARVARVFTEVEADRLTVTDEEHHAAEGTWSMYLAVPAVARFHVLLGFVDGDPTTTHIQRLPSSEIVDSVGTGGNG